MEHISVVISGFGPYEGVETNPAYEVPAALAHMNVAALCTEPAFWDERYYAKSTLSDYLNSLPPEQIVSDGHMRVYLLDASLVGKLHVAAEPPVMP